MPHQIFKVSRVKYELMYLNYKQLELAAFSALYGKLPLPVDGSQYNNFVIEHQGKRFMKVARKAPTL